MSSNKRARGNQTFGVNDFKVKSQNRLSHHAVDPQGLLTQETVRRHIDAGTCPICGSGPYRVLPVHTNKIHGVDKYELRNMAGFTTRDPISSKEFRERASALAKERDLGHMIGQDRTDRDQGTRRWTDKGRESVGAAGREAISALPLAERIEHARKASAALTEAGRKRKSEITTLANSDPERKKKFVAATQAPEAIAKRIAGIKASRQDSLLGHGTRASYRRGCRCDDCRAANAEKSRIGRLGKTNAKDKIVTA